MAGRPRKKRSNKLSLLLIVLLLLAIAGGFFYASQQSDKSKDLLVPTQQELHLDLKNKSQSAHNAIDKILKNEAKWEVDKGIVLDKSSKREDKKGDILWTQKVYTVVYPIDEDIDMLINNFTAKIKAENLFVLNKSTNNDGITLSVGIYGKAGEQEVSCVTDVITFIKGAKKKIKDKKLTPLSGTMTVLVDDCGYAMEPVESMTALPIEMNFAIIPFKPNSSAALEMILNRGKVAMLHLPMEPVNAAAASENTMVTVSMTKDAAQAFTIKAINSLPGIKGVNNHQGSKATSNRSTMKAVLEVIKSDGLFFIDSNTIAQSIGDQVAREIGVRTARNQRFLDNSSNVEDIKAKIMEAAESASQTGNIVVICHARPSTAQAWQEVYGELLERGIKFVRADAIVD